MVACIFLSCSENAEYLAAEKRALESGERHDSIFLGFYFGMPSKDFYSHCWTLNRQGLIREGASNMSVYYPIKGFEYPASSNFYPAFYEDRIFEMPMVFTYESWAPWNKHLAADRLQLEVLDLMEDWFGTGFYEVIDPNEEENKAFVKIDGNRRVSIYIKDDQYVKVDIIDLPVQRRMQEEAENQADDK